MKSLPALAVTALGLSVVVGCNRTEPSKAVQETKTASAEPAAPKPIVPPAIGIYVTNESSGDLSIIDADTRAVVATVPLGKRPRGIAVSPDHTTLYVALSGSPNAGPGVDEKTLPPPDRKADGIGVVDLAQGKLIKVLTSGPDPEQLAVSPDGTHVYIANEDGAKLSVVDVNTGEIVESFAIGEEPEGVSIEPKNGRVWVTSEEDGA